MGSDFIISTDRVYFEETKSDKKYFSYVQV